MQPTRWTAVRGPCSSPPPPPSPPARALSVPLTGCFVPFPMQRAETYFLREKGEGNVRRYRERKRCTGENHSHKYAWYHCIAAEESRRAQGYASKKRGPCTRILRPNAPFTLRVKLNSPSEDNNSCNRVLVVSGRPTADCQWRCANVN